jgi:hypothetical protein
LDDFFTGMDFSSGCELRHFTLNLHFPVIRRPQVD